MHISCFKFFNRLITSEIEHEKKAEEDKFDLDKMFSTVKAIDEIIISYFSLTVKITYRVEEDLENAKNYLLVAHWSKRDDLKLVALNLFEIISIYEKFMVKEIFPKGYDLRHAVKQLARRNDVITKAIQYDGMLLEYASKEVLKDPKIVEVAVKKDVKSLQYANSADDDEVDVDR